MAEVRFLKSEVIIV